MKEIEQYSEEWKALMTDMSPTVYILRCNEYYKIGFTNGSIECRIHAMQTGNPYKLELAFALKNKNAKTIEKYIHSKFENKRVLREWFHLDEKDFIKIEDIIKEMWNNNGELK